MGRRSELKKRETGTSSKSSGEREQQWKAVIGGRSGREVRPDKNLERGETRKD